jgi:hypothetical protein
LITAKLQKLLTHLSIDQVKVISPCDGGAKWQRSFPIEHNVNTMVLTHQKVF